jgi:transposase
MEFHQQTTTRNGRADSARRARLILLLADGHTWAQIRSKLDCSDSYIDRWCTRFEADRLAGLFARHAGRRRYKVTDRIEARVLAHDQTQAHGRLHALVLAQACRRVGRKYFAHDGIPHLGQAQHQTAPARRLYRL